jgi:monoamine oxidase
MLNTKDAAEHINASGFTASEEDVLRWIQDGSLKAELSPRRNSTYKITLMDLTDFIIDMHTKQLAAQLQHSQLENRKLSDKLDLLKTKIHIEQSKVRTLKKMLNAQIEALGTHSIHLKEFMGLNPSTSEQALKKEFKKLLKALHPDRGGDERLFKVFREHYENLK